MESNEHPQYKEPKNISKQVLPKLSTRHTIEGRTQEFTVGSRNAESDGVAAKGSKLEAQAINMQNSKKAKRAKKKSR